MDTSTPEKYPVQTESSQSHIYFQSLDGLRVVAALSIAVFHFYDQWAGYLAVEFFFMLSGFLFAHGYLSRNKVLTLRGYAQRRFARLYPMHLFSLVVFVLVYWLIDGGLPSYADGTLTSFVSHLLMMHGIGLNPHGLTWNYPSWAISVELWVGATAFVLVSAGVKLRVLLFISLVCLLVMYLAVGDLSGTYQNISGFLNAGLLRGFSAFFLGIVSYAIFLRYRKIVWSRLESSRLEKRWSGSFGQPIGKDK